MVYVKKNWQNTPSTNTPINADNLNHIEQGIYDAQSTANAAQELASETEAKLDALQARETTSTAAGMTDTTKAYIYTGSEAGYNYGHWYYWNGSAWTDGGVYNSAGVNTDTTLSVSGAPADSKATGDEITNLNSALNSYTKHNDVTKQIFDGLNATIVKGITEDGANSFTSNTRGAIIIVGSDGYSSGDQYSFNYITDSAYGTMHIDKINILSANAYPTASSAYLQIGSSSGANKRGTITLNSNATYILLSVYLANGYDASTYDFSDLLAKMVVRKGGYDTTYYPYSLIDVQEDNLSDELKSKINQSGDVNAYRQILTQTLHVGSNVLTDASASLGTGWSGTLSNGYAHASGNTSALSFSISTTSGDSYLISFNLTNPAEDALKVKIGNSAEVDVYNGTTDAYVGIVADGGTLSIIPTSAWSGTITNLKLRKVQESGDEVELAVDNIDTKVNDPSLTGFWNVIVGINNFANNQNGSRNISIGYASLLGFKSGTRNVAIGTFSMKSLVSGDRNVAIGSDALWKATKASDCVAIGKASMEAAGTDLANNVAVGSQTLKKVTTGKDNVAVGHGAIGNAQSNGSARNTVVGSLAAFYSNGYNTAVGYKASYFNKGTENTCVGDEAGGELYVTGNNNTFLGAKCGFDNTGASAGSVKTVNDSIAIGKGAKVTKSNQMVLGSADITEVVICGNKKLTFNNDGTVTWSALS